PGGYGHRHVAGDADGLLAGRVADDPVRHRTVSHPGGNNANSLDFDRGVFHSVYAVGACPGAMEHLSHGLARCVAGTGVTRPHRVLPGEDTIEAMGQDRTPAADGHSFSESPAVAGMAAGIWPIPFVLRSC